jgi:hypothetical protein
MKPAPFDRAAIMRDAHKRYRDGLRLGIGWSFGQCLEVAWIAAKVRRGESLDALIKARKPPRGRRALRQTSRRSTQELHPSL